MAERTVCIRPLLWRSCACWIALFCLAAVGTAQSMASPLARLAAGDVNVPACQAYVDGELAEAPTAATVLGVLGVQTPAQWQVGKRGDGKQRQFYLAFTAPVAVGSVLVQSNATLKYLKAGAALPTNPLAADAWVTPTIPSAQSGWRLVALPPGTKTQALLVSLARSGGDWDRLKILRLCASRLHNIVPEAVANGEAEYINYGNLHPPVPYVAANITRGAGSWQSHGPADQSERINRTPVSSTFPTWFVISWDTPRELCALRLQSNFRKFTVQTYIGPAGVNPAVGGANDWENVPSAIREDAGAKWVFFQPLTTRGIRLLATETADTRYGRIDGLQAYVDLHEQPVPERVNEKAAPPCTFTATLPGDGYVTAVVDGPNGQRIRNLTARDFRAAGPLTLGWDLKDEDGQMVSPGTYRWKLLYHPGLTQKYQMTAYPNVNENAPENSPWLNGQSGPGGWMADHSAPRAVCAVGDRVFFSDPCCESGVALIECDLTGKKSWGHGNIIAWTGPSYLASDEQALYTAPATGGVDYIWRFTLPEKRMDTMLKLDDTTTRQRGIRGMAARDGKLYLSINAGTNWLENAASPADVDLERCEPRYAPAPKTNKYDDPDPRSDFLRLLRLTGTPPGCKGLTYLETAKDGHFRQHIVVTFKKAIPVGSLVFPAPQGGNVRMRISVLNAKASFPPEPRRDAAWTTIWEGKGDGWVVVPAPPQTSTRALRFSFDHGQDEVEDEGKDMRGEDPEAVLEDEFRTSGGVAWQAKLEGMKILRRRFTNLFPQCTVRVNSGTVSPTGEWDAARTTPLTTADPGIYAMEWGTAQRIRGLAIKEIDGKQTEIDIWTGPEGTPVSLTDEKYWTHIASYEQKLRFYYQPDQNNNTNARYMDGYVDFGEEVTTRAVRLRVVEQWMWKDEGRAGCVGVRRDRGGETLDPTRCRIYGVAVLQYLGEEPAIDPLVTERLEVYDIATKKLDKEFPLERGGAITFSPAGDLYAISAGTVVKIDPATGESEPLKLAVQHPRALACDRQGNLYVFDGAADQRVVKVFTPAGKLLRTIGTPGGRTAGPWDPGQFTSRAGVTVDLAVDAKDQLWVVEADFTPKRISLWSTDGTFRKDFLGNTAYGGGGCLDPNEKTRLFYGPMEFALDWATGKTRLKGITWLGDSDAGEQPITLKDREYLVTRPLFNRQAVGVVYLYQQGRLKRLAAVGRAGNFAPLRTADVLKKLGKTPIGDCNFTWTDRNDDGQAQGDEVEFFPASSRGDAPGRFEETLSIDAGNGARYEVISFLANGAPVYQRVQKPFGKMALKLVNGNFFVMGDAPNGGKTADGTTLWTYPAEGWGVHALYRAKPYRPAQVVSEFDVIGHETAHAGDLGEFLVTNTNTGVWHIWTADGMLAGQLFRDLRSPNTQPWSMPEHARGLDLTGVTVGQEHFAGYFCRTQDNKYYAVAGHNHISVVEVEGLEKFVRRQGEITVTPQMLQQATEWNRKQLSRQLYEAAKLIQCRRATQKIEIDGTAGEWDSANAHLEDRDVTLSLAYDDTHLYLAIQGKGVGPLANSGNDWKRLFKTGAAVDLQLGADPHAATNRTSPAPGDLRLLMTLVKGQPIAVLYQPNAPGAKPEEAWETHTMVFHAGFDRVVQVKDIEIAARNDEDGYCLEAAISLKTLGLTIRPDLQLKMDWGVLTSGPDGTEVMQRLYWANPLTAIISDEAAEAMLHPDLWGTVRFLENEGDKGLEPEPGDFDF